MDVLVWLNIGSEKVAKSKLSVRIIMGRHSEIEIQTRVYSTRPDEWGGAARWIERAA